MDVALNKTMPRSFGRQGIESRVLADPRLWIGFNVHVSGPSGSGKLSFIRALSAVATASASVRVYDFETEPDTQSEIMDLVLNELRDAVEGADSHSDTVHVLRHLHRVRGQALAAFLKDIKAIIDNSIEQFGPERTPRLHATSIDNARWPKSVRETLQQVFPCWIRLSDDCTSQRDMGRFIKHVLTDLNRRYGRDVNEVEAEAIGAIRRHAKGRSLHELRNLIERAYLVSPGGRLQVSSLL